MIFLSLYYRVTGLLGETGCQPEDIGVLNSLGNDYNLTTASGPDTVDIGDGNGPQQWCQFGASVDGDPESFSWETPTLTSLDLGASEYDYMDPLTGTWTYQAACNSDWGGDPFT